MNKSAGSVWDDIADDVGEAMQWKIQSALLRALHTYIVDNALTHDAMVRQMKIDRRRVGDLVIGEINAFTIDELVAMAERVGVNPLKIVTCESDVR